MVVEERPPGLGGRCAPLRDQPGDGSLGHVDAELQELAMDSWRAPQRIRRGHFLTRAVISALTGGGPRWTGRTAQSSTRGSGGAATAARCRGHDHERLPPPGPDPGQPDPQEAIGRAQPRPGRRSLVHGELVAQGEVLEGELTMAAAEEGEEPKQVEHEGDHRAETVAASEPTDQPLRRPGFGEGQGLMAVGLEPALDGGA